MDISVLLSKAKNLSPVIRIGKMGLTEGVLQEIEKLLKKRKLIKIKILNNCPEEKKAMIEEIVSRTGALLVFHIGNVFALFKD